MPTEARRNRSPFAAAAAVAAALAHFVTPGLASATTGPDVTVISIGSTSNWGATGGIRAYSVGTTSCNVGSAPIAWCDAGTCLGGTLQSNDHPVIAQNMYRLKDGRFEQIGMAWLKHGWLATNTPNGNCGSCTTPPGGGDQLGVGCTDTYDSTLNGGSGNPGTCDSGSCRLGQRSAVNATSGVFPMPYHNVAHPQNIDQRLQVLENDVNPALNSGALYWVEGQYIAADDSVANNAFNNASYRRVTVGAASPFNLTLADSTVREKTAVEAWKAQDGTVEIFNSDFCTTPVERFQVARKVTGSGPWHYEYAVRNMNSDHAAGAFSVQFPPNTTISNTYFRDVDSHSGEPYSTTDWTTTVDSAAGSIRWATEDFASNPDANALRFATMYTFAFDADAPVANAAHLVELFKPGGEAVADAGQDAAICAGDSVQIGTPAVAGYTYLWSPGGQTTAQITVSPASTTVYTLTASNGCASAQDTVEVAVDSGPAAPTLLSPADGTAGLSAPVALDWSASPGATSYALEVATDTNFANVVVDEVTASPGYEIATLPLDQYFWRVTSAGSCPGATSGAFMFVVDNAIFVDGFESEDTSEWSWDIP